MNDLKVCWWPIDKPIPYARNSRKIPERAIDKVAASIKEFGWRQAIVVDKDGVIICGHTRLLAAKKLGLKQVPVHVADNLTPAQVKAYRLMDNRSHEETDWDIELARAGAGRTAGSRLRSGTDRLRPARDRRFPRRLRTGRPRQRRAPGAGSPGHQARRSLALRQAPDPLRRRHLGRGSWRGCCGDREAAPDGHRSALWN